MSVYIFHRLASVPVLGHRQTLHEGQPASGEALQAGDAVVAQMQLSEEDLVVQTGRLRDKRGGAVSSRWSNCEVTLTS